MCFVCALCAATDATLARLITVNVPRSFSRSNLPRSVSDGLTRQLQLEAVVPGMLLDQRAPSV